MRPDDCGAGTPFATLPAGARQLGAHFKFENAQWFVVTSSAVFPDEATARSWTQTGMSPAYVECRRVTHTYRVGRTVIAVSIDVLSLPSDPPTLNAKMADDVTKALTAVYARID